MISSVFASHGCFTQTFRRSQLMALSLIAFLGHLDLAQRILLVIATRSSAGAGKSAQASFPQWLQIIFFFSVLPFAFLFSLFANVVANFTRRGASTPSARPLSVHEPRPHASEKPYCFNSCCTAEVILASSSGVKLEVARIQKRGPFFNGKVIAKRGSMTLALRKQFTFAAVI